MKMAKLMHAAKAKKEADPETKEQESKKECGLHLHGPEGDVAPGQEAAAFEEPASAATSREHRRELV